MVMVSPCSRSCRPLFPLGLTTLLVILSLTSGCRCFVRKPASSVAGQTVYLPAELQRLPLPPPPEDPLVIQLRELERAVAGLDPAIQAFLAENSRLTAEREWSALFDAAIDEVKSEIAMLPIEQLKKAARQRIEEILIRRLGPEVARPLARGNAGESLVGLGFKLAELKLQFARVVAGRADLPVLAGQRQLILNAAEMVLAVGKEAKFTVQTVLRLEAEQREVTARVRALIATCREEAARLDELPSPDSVLVAPAAR